MKVRGKEIKFLRTVKTTSDLAKLCPDKDIDRISEIFSGSVDSILENGAKVIHFLNEGYEMNEHLNNPDHKPNIISEEEIMYLDEQTFTELLTDAMNSLMEGTEQSIELEPSKKNEEMSQE